MLSATSATSGDAAWVAATSGLYASGTEATIANTVIRQTFSQNFVSANPSTLANIGATVTIRAGGTFLAVATPSVELNVRSLSLEQVLSFDTLGASGRWYAERTMVVTGAYIAATGRWPVASFSRYFIDGETVLQVADGEAFWNSTAGVAVEWKTAAAGNSITQTFLSVTVAR